MNSGMGTVRKSWIFKTLVLVGLMSSTGCAIPRPGTLIFSVEVPLKKTPVTEEGTARVTYRLDPTFR